MMRHNMGLGNVDLDRLKNLKGVEPSHKFVEKLTVRQKMAEEKLLENRLKQLHMEEQKMQKQIALYNRTTRIAEEIDSRRKNDNY
jgi:hypothetical protein